MESYNNYKRENNGALMRLYHVQLYERPHHLAVQVAKPEIQPTQIIP